MFAPNTKILVVDDMKTMRMFVKKHLKELGFENIQEADDGATALPALEQAANAGEPFGLLLSDWSMPKMTGLDLLKQVRAHAKLNALPVVLVTAESDKAQVIEAIKAGVSNYLMKPFTADDLKQKMAAAFSKVKMAG